MEGFVALEGFYPTREDAEKIKDLLEENGVTAIILEANSSKYRPLMGFTAQNDDFYKMRFFEIWVKKNNVKKAEEVFKMIDEAPMEGFPSDEEDKKQE